MSYNQHQGFDEHFFQFFYLREIDREEYIPEGQAVLAKYISNKKTKWKTWVNRLTNFIVITERFVIYVELIKWFGWPLKNDDSIFRVRVYPKQIISSVHEIEKSGNRNEVCIQYRNPEGEKCFYKIRFGTDCKKVIESINAKGS